MVSKHNRNIDCTQHTKQAATRVLNVSLLEWWKYMKHSLTLLNICNDLLCLILNASQSCSLVSWKTLINFSPFIFTKHTHTRLTLISQKEYSTGIQNCQNKWWVCFFVFFNWDNVYHVENKTPHIYNMHITTYSAVTTIRQLLKNMRNSNQTLYIVYRLSPPSLYYLHFWFKTFSTHLLQLPSLLRQYIILFVVFCNTPSCHNVFLHMKLRLFSPGSVTTVQHPFSFLPCLHVFVCFSGRVSTIHLC